MEEIINVLLGSNDADELLSGSVKILEDMSISLGSLESYSSLILKYISHSNPYIRIQGLLMVSKENPFPSLSTREVMVHYTRDIDETVRNTALQYIMEAAPEILFDLLRDSSQEVQISTIHLLFRTFKASNDEFLLVKLEPLAMSQYKPVVLESLQVISQLSLTPKTVNSLLNNDNMTSYSGLMLNLLESEWFEVRLAVIECLMSLMNTLMASTSFERINSIVYELVKILLDAINDEFREVRISVFKILSNLAPYFILKKNKDVDSCIFNIREPDEELRYAIYDFLSKVRIDLNSNTKTVLESLINLLAKFPADKDKIFSVCACIGRNNFKHASFISSELLGLDQRLQSSEQDWNNIFYIAKLIYIMNARHLDPSISLPVTVEKHMNYLTDMYPLYMPAASDSIETGNLVLEETLKKLNKTYKSLIQKHTKMIRQPHRYYKNSEATVRFLVKKTLKLQHKYRVKGLESVFGRVKLNSHILLFLGFISDHFTCKVTEPWRIKQQLSNIYMAGKALEDREIAEACSQAKQHFERGQVYEMFLKLLKKPEFPHTHMLQFDERKAEITYPSNEVFVHECDVLLVQGTGEQDLFTIIQYPDNSLEFERVVVQASCIVSRIRIHRANFPLPVRICFAAVCHSKDVLVGTGFIDETIKVPAYIPISKYSNIKLKP